MVEESIPLTNDRGDVMQKSWEDICRQVSNYGKIMYALQKIRGFFDKKD